MFISLVYVLVSVLVKGLIYVLDSVFYFSADELLCIIKYLTLVLDSVFDRGIVYLFSF